MKKCILILMVILTITACKKENADSAATTSQTSVNNAGTLPDCITLKDYYRISDSDQKANIAKKAEWLRQHGDNVCKCTLEEAILYEHKVRGNVTNQKGNYPITWGKLKGIIKSYGYNKYLAVEFKDTIITGVKLVNKYEDADYCFSTALIRTLGKNFTLGDDTTFEFSFAEVTENLNNTQGAVVIQVNGTPYYYDYSTQPPFLGNENMPF